jgi:hypothetical protein
MRTNTEKFENSHGRKPRGHGFWGFELTGTDGHGRYTTQEYFESGKLTDAKESCLPQVQE